MKFYITIDTEPGQPKEVHGPYVDHDTAFKAGQYLAADGGRVEVSTDEIRCDFCSKRAVAWTYPADDFVELNTMWGSAGDWAACMKCHDLIEAGDFKALAQRSVDRYWKYGPGMLPDTPVVRAMLLKEISSLHRAFVVARRGEVQKEEVPRGE